MSTNLARRRYIPLPKLLKLNVNEFWRRTESGRIFEKCYPRPISAPQWKLHPPPLEAVINFSGLQHFPLERVDSMKS
jgi:hypothetical protein